MYCARPAWKRSASDSISKEPRRLSSNMPPVALLAGGLALRLRPQTLKVPKAMIEVAGEPFIAHQMRLMRREGVPRVVLCVGYLGEEIEAFIKDGSRIRRGSYLLLRWSKSPGDRWCITQGAPATRSGVSGDVW